MERAVSRFFTFHAPMYVKVEDVQAGFLLRVLQLTVVMYALVQLISDKTFMLFDTASMTGRIFPGGLGEFDVQEARDLYCDNPDFDFPQTYNKLNFGEQDPGWVNISCSLWNSGHWMEHDRLSLSIVTLKHEGMQYDNGSYVPKTQFYIGAEHAVLQIFPTVFADLVQIREALPATVLVDQEGNSLMEWKKGDVIRVSARSLLLAAGAGLAVRNVELKSFEKFLIPGVPDPIYAVSGAEFDVVFTFDNKWSNGGDVRAILEVQQSIAFAAGGYVTAPIIINETIVGTSTSRQRTIRFNLSPARGQLGKQDFVVCLNFFVRSTVLLGIASFMTASFLRFVSPSRRDVEREIFRSLNLRSESATGTSKVAPTLTFRE